jgi:hypothetical protein
LNRRTAFVRQRTQRLQVREKIRIFAWSVMMQQSDEKSSVIPGLNRNPTEVQSQ